MKHSLILTVLFAGLSLLSGARALRCFNYLHVKGVCEDCEAIPAIYCIRRGLNHKSYDPQSFTSTCWQNRVDKGQEIFFSSPPSSFNGSRNYLQSQRQIWYPYCIKAAIPLEGPIGKVSITIRSYVYLNRSGLTGTKATLYSMNGTPFHAYLCDSNKCNLAAPFKVHSVVSLCVVALLVAIFW